MFAFAEEPASAGIDLLDVTSGVLMRDAAAHPPARAVFMGRALLRDITVKAMKGTSDDNQLPCLRGP